MKKGISLALAAAMALGSFIGCVNVSAENTAEASQEIMEITTDSGFTIAAEQAEQFENAEILSEEFTNPASNIYELSRTYRLEDGTVAHDILTVTENMTRSANGSNTVTRQTDASNFSTVYICASFDWYTSCLWSYVQCSSMTAYHVDKASNVGCERFIKSKSNGYIKSGKAYAQVNYYFYNVNIPVQSSSGTFKITCTDSGTISDNG